MDNNDKLIRSIFGKRKIEVTENVAVLALKGKQCDNDFFGTIHAILTAARKQGFTRADVQFVGYKSVGKTQVMTYVHQDGHKLMCRSNYGDKPSQAFIEIILKIFE